MWEKEFRTPAPPTPTPPHPISSRTPGNFKSLLPLRVKQSLIKEIRSDIVDPRKERRDGKGEGEYPLYFLM